MIKAYKVFNSDWTCRDFQYEVGKEYTHKGEISIFGSGFHACTNVSDCFNYYSFDPNNKVAEVELSGQTDRQGNYTKIAAEKIKIIREISWEEVLTLANTGTGNSGHSNSGDRNSGDWNQCNQSNGYFNTISPEKIKVFNKDCLLSDWIEAEKPICFT